MKNYPNKKNNAVILDLDMERAWKLAQYLESMDFKVSMFGSYDVLKSRLKNESHQYDVLFSLDELNPVIDCLFDECNCSIPRILYSAEYGDKPFAEWIDILGIINIVNGPDDSEGMISDDKRGVIK